MGSFTSSLLKQKRSWPRPSPIKDFSGKSLAERRHEVQLTQAELAELVGVSKQAVGFWEQSRSYPTLAHANKLQEVLYEQLRKVRDSEKLYMGIKLKTLKRQKEELEKRLK